MSYIWSIYSIQIYLSYSYTYTLCGTSLLPSLRLWLITPFSVPWHYRSGHVAGHKVRTFFRRGSWDQAEIFLMLDSLWCRYQEFLNNCYLPYGQSTWHSPQKVGKKQGLWCQETIWYCWFCWWTKSWGQLVGYLKNYTKVYWFQVVQDFWTINSMIWSICYHKRSKFKMAWYMIYLIWK